MPAIYLKVSDVAGCILAELYTGYPLFPGENEVEQLACLMEVLGTPPDDLISIATRRRLFFGKFLRINVPSLYKTQRATARFSCVLRKIQNDVLCVKTKTKVSINVYACF